MPPSPRIPLACLVLLALAAPAAAAGMPERIGDCVDTRVTEVSTRLVSGGKPVAGSGSSIAFANGGSQVSYETVAPIEASRPGDPVRICLVSVPRDCPPGDDRGRMYRTTNQRSQGSWTLAESTHSCGGA